MQVSLRHTRAPRRRLLIAALGALAVLASPIAPGAVRAVEPIDAREAGPTPRRTAEPDPRTPAPPPPVTTRPAPRPSPTARPTPTVTPPSESATDADAPGYDISWPQCDDGSYPESFSFAIVGVNGGRVHSGNPCLGSGDAPSQLEWAGRDADLYINTGNPGPQVSRFWPRGGTEPRECDTDATPGDDTTACAYLYGWNAAADSYGRALDAFISLGWADADAERIPGERTWWLDVETANSWRLDWGMNVATLQGAVDYLESMDVDEVGVYSTPLLWWRVTGGTDAFTDLPSWHAGAGNEQEALEMCNDEGLTGGELRMVQWVERGLDHNVRCP